MHSNLRPAYLSFLYSMLASYEHNAVDSAPPLEFRDVRAAYGFMNNRYAKFCRRNLRVSRERIAYTRTVPRHKRDPAKMKAFREKNHKYLRAHLTAALQYITWYLRFERVQPGEYFCQ